jgi:tetratricopeptide (TPR) repeat protein
LLRWTRTVLEYFRRFLVIMIASRFGARSAACAITVLSAVFVSSAGSQTETKAGSATVEGTVCGPQHRPLSAATVTLESKAKAPPVVTETDSEGHYRFSALPEGTYTLRAKLSGYRDTTNESVIAISGHLTSVVLLLEPAEASASAKRGPSSVEYSDEPQFTVAGVTDPTSLGGHGSNAVLRTKEALAKDTAALNRSAPYGMKSVPGAPAGATSTTVASTPPGENASEDERVGELLLEEGKPQQALPYLERAANLEPDDYNASYALALACEQSLHLSRADQIVHALLAREDRAELHALLADTFEKERRFVEAAREYERAAERDPSEPNLFAWGAELLLHRAYIPASEVLEKGHRRFPKSARMLVGLGVAFYARGSLDEGVRQLIEACDLDPSDPHPYLFLGKIQDVERSERPEVLDRFKRFVSLQPQNALAYYYYGVGLAKARGSSESFEEVENLLLKSIALDPHLGDAYLHLGILYSQRKDFPKALSAYQKAIENTPLPAEAHFRLAQIYRQMAKSEEARREIELFDEVSRKEGEEAERDRREMGQFTYTLRGPSARAPTSTPE